MIPEDRTSLLQELRDSRDMLLDSVDSLSDEDASRATSAGWSILSFVEHCVLAEEAMLGALEHGGEPVEASDRSRMEASIMKHGASRVRKIEAPSAMVPKGRFATLADAKAAFLAVRARTIEMIEHCEGDLRDRMVQHPIGRITERECVLLIIQHPRRHAGQIQEQRTTLGLS